MAILYIYYFPNKKPEIIGEIVHKEEVSLTFTSF